MEFIIPFYDISLEESQTEIDRIKSEKIFSLKWLTLRYEFMNIHQLDQKEIMENEQLILALFSSFWGASYKNAVTKAIHPR